MTNYACFLRGINVGGHRKIPMADLRALCAQQIGSATVQSYIASGNLVFSTDMAHQAIAEALQAGIKARFGFEVTLMLFTEAELQVVFETCPTPTAPGNLAHAYLCNDTPVLDAAGVAALRSATETVTTAPRVVWLCAPDGIGRSKLAAKLEKLCGVQTTARNLNTIRKVLAMMA